MVHLDTRTLGGGIEMWKKLLPNERYVTKPGGNLNRLKINILKMWPRRKYTQL